MAKRRNISRRDFLGGVALGAAAGSFGGFSGLARALETKGEGGYPPSRTGLRGSHPGSFEVAHSVAWGGAKYPVPAMQTDKTYDLVVVGGGISGLAAAHFYRQKMGPKASILVLDNHDDFGGHAKRNEFDVDGKRLICYGGSQSIDTPGSYSPQSAQMLKDLNIHTDRFYEYYDREFDTRKHLERGYYFSKAAYGEDVIAPHFDGAGGVEAAAHNAEIIARYPLPAEARAALEKLLSSDTNYLADTPKGERAAYLRGITYREFLLDVVGVPEPVYVLLRDNIRGWWGVGWDAQSALEAVRMEMPGTLHLDVGEMKQREPERNEPYIFHFPDGNAGVARALVRKLIPAAMPGNTMEDMVLARVDYSVLDRPENPCRIRLNSTAVNVQHGPQQKFVDVTYVRGGEVERVRGQHVVMACYNDIIPYICPELPADQREAIEYSTKVPLVYLSIAVRNWRAFAELGYSHLSMPNPQMMHSIALDFPVSMGGYQFADDPDQPTVLHGSFVPCVPDQGLQAKQQHIAGRRQLYETTFEQFEEHIVSTLDGALGKAGFDVDRDLAAITVNRWPHGYAYEYNEYSDPPEYGPHNGPHLLGARQMGRISIANSDASAYAFVDGAVDAAWRATQEQLSI
ncbi:FAD-dependent oxidoreductase [Mangrovimicrobium sediminis]|uniref:FAD-dependent oxidoreductase n=1 Tax=Mangrovimicrobium sediminis TaxID=2562682 RepID=A0A4Z0M7B8_9GAMM|nr:NAD(P)/FAD-dependent oxidoreductase [Haliea sp. SAOS-164]TGD75296.1 FAD-dependent oxidoreductase [Haliea sp. SAOS-164]